MGELYTIDPDKYLSGAVIDLGLAFLAAELNLESNILPLSIEIYALKDTVIKSIYSFINII